MENNEKNMSSEESLRLIHQMIKSVKEELEDDSFYYLFWGWLVLVASIGNYVLEVIGYANPSMVWLLMPIGGIITGVYAYRDKKSKKVSTYTNEVMMYVLRAYLISMMIVLFAGPKLGEYCYPMLMMLYAIMLYTSGGIIKFKPLMYGGYANWILAIGCFFATGQVQLLLLAAAMLFGFIIPGHMLKAKTDRAMSTSNNPSIS
jgi:hypothetical protein